MKHILIVSPHFSPVNAPDMQRARMMLPYLQKLGWKATVLAVAPALIEGAVIEPLLEETYPRDVRVVRVRGLSPRLTRRFGFGSLWFRCGRALCAAGDELLARERFDLVFFTTTQFEAFQLGPRWLRRHGVPYMLDYQDPWTNPYYARTGTRPPGGRLKFALSQWVARRIEPTVLRQAAGIIAVSDAYGGQLAESYPWFDPQRVQVLPFGAAVADFDQAIAHPPARPLIEFDDGHIHYVYTGRCGPDMAFALRVLFRAFRHHLETAPAAAAQCRFHFIGTDYAPPPMGHEWARPIALSEGVGNYVEEHCPRVPYFEALYYLVRAHALVAIGSDDPTYTASKIFPYILARRTLLMIYHERSLVLEFAQQVGAGRRFAFSRPEYLDALAAAVHESWFANGISAHAPSFDEAAFAPFTAEALTLKLAHSFDLATSSRRAFVA